MLRVGDAIYFSYTTKPVVNPSTGELENPRHFPATINGIAPNLEDRHMYGQWLSVVIDVEEAKASGLTPPYKTDVIKLSWVTGERVVF
jgi:hypothetical protein